jgi:hypothetical protein
MKKAFISGEVIMAADKIYIIVRCGYEGLEELISVHLNPDEAKEVLKARKIIEDEFGDEFSFKPDQICVMAAEVGQKPKCVCQELGVPPKEQWLY